MKDILIGIVSGLICLLVAYQLIYLLMGHTEALDNETVRKLVLGGIASLAFAHTYFKKRFSAYRALAGMAELIRAGIVTDKGLEKLTVKPGSVAVAWVAVIGGIFVMSKAAKDLFEWYEDRRAKPQSSESSANTSGA